MNKTLNWMKDDQVVAKELAHALNQVDIYHHQAYGDMVGHKEGSANVKWSIPYAMTMLEEYIKSAEKGIVIARQIVDEIQQGWQMMKGEKGK